MNYRAIPLNGSWEFYWQKFLEPGSKPKEDKISYITVPSPWGENSLREEKIQHKGFGTYRVFLQLEPEKDFALKLNIIGSACVLYVNSKPLFSSGKTGKSLSESVPFLKPAVLFLPRSPDGSYELVLHVSNFHDKTGGLWNSIYLGSNEQISAMQKKSFAADLFLTGSLLIMAFYHLGLFILRREDESTLFFSFFCLLLAVRSLLTEERYLYELLPSLDWNVGLRLEFLTFYLGFPGFLWYLQAIFQDIPYWAFAKVLIYPILGVSLLLLLLPSHLFCYTLYPVQIMALFAILYVLFIMVYALAKKLKGAKVFLLGISIFAIFFLNDIFYGMQLIHTGNYSSLGLFVFIFSQAFSLSMRFSHAYSVSKKLSGTLKERNQELYLLKENLEVMVHDRTRELAVAKKEVEKLNEFSRLINESVDLDYILKQVYRYVFENLGLDILWLTLVNEQENFLYAYKWSSPDDNPIQEEKLKFLKNYTHKLEPELGTLYYTYKNNQILYIPDVRENVDETRDVYLNHYNQKKIRGTKQDLKIVLSGRLRTIIQIPLVLKNRVIGILNLSAYDKQIYLDPNQLQSLERFSEQIVGVIHNSHLLEETEKAKKLAEQEKEKSEKLLLNILPRDVALELREKGYTEPIMHDCVSVLFTDFQGFTKIAEKMEPAKLIEELDRCFSYFDSIVDRYNLEKLKTIGDSYMCAGGVPISNKTNAIDCILAAMEIQSFMLQMKKDKIQNSLPYWELRLGIHTGPLVAGVIGEKKFAYDVWGDTVNTASRMESSGTPNRINISGVTYSKVKDFFHCEYRGKINAKNKGEIDMYYVNGLLPEFSLNGDGKTPNETFFIAYEALKNS